MTADGCADLVAEVCMEHRTTLKSNLYIYIMGFKIQDPRFPKSIFSNS